MFNIVPLVIIVASLGVSIYIIIRKFPQLARIQTQTIQTEKEKEVKNKILNERLKRKTAKATKLVGGLFGSLKSKVSDSLQEAKENLEAKKKELEKPELPEMLITKEDYEKQEEYIEQTLEEAEELAYEDEFEKAEQKYIDIISQDPKNVDAYEGLGWLYFENKMYKEARETLAFVLRLDSTNAKAHNDLAEVDVAEGKFAEALVHARKAVEIEPRNPKYITAQIDIALRMKDKVVAQMGLQKLQEVNPQNALISEYQEDISRL